MQRLPDLFKADDSVERLREQYLEAFAKSREEDCILEEDDALRLLEDLAHALWKSGDMEWDWDQGYCFLHQRLIESERLREKYRKALAPEGVQFFEKEFNRTVMGTFHSGFGMDDGWVGFRNTSAQNPGEFDPAPIEYALACTLLRGLIEDELHLWEVPPPSEQTLQFLGQLLELCHRSEQQQALAHLSALLQFRIPQATFAAFAYFLRASALGLPTPTEHGRIDLSGECLDQWKIEGRADALLNMQGTILDGASLAGSRWEFVDLTNASFLECKASHATFNHVCAEGIRIQDCDFTMSYWNRVKISQLDSSLADWTGATLMKVDGEYIYPNGLRFFDRQYKSKRVCPETFRRIHILAKRVYVSKASLKLSSNEETLMTTCNEGYVRLWDLSSGICKLVIDFQPMEIRGYGFSEDGKWLMFEDDAGWTKLWSVDENCEKFRLWDLFPDDVRGFSSDSQHLAQKLTTGDIGVWSLHTGLLLHHLASESFSNETIKLYYMLTFRNLII